MRLLGTLRCVSLRGCEGVTDDGIAQLAALPRLARLVSVRHLHRMPCRLHARPGQCALLHHLVDCQT